MRAWLQFTIKQFKITLAQEIESVFDEDGKQLLRLNEIDFINRIPEVTCIESICMHACMHFNISYGRTYQ